MPTHLRALPCQLALAACLAVLAACSGPGSPRPGPVPAADAVIQGRLFDARSGRVHDDGVVVVHAGRVRCSGARHACRWPAATPLHDYGQALILPGLIDLHVHARPHYAGGFVQAGVTTVRDASNSLAAVAAVRAVQGAPRIVAAGPLIDGPRSVVTDAADAGLPLQEQPVLVVADADKARRAVEALAAAGADWIKLYEQLPLDAYHAAVAAAREQGVPVMTDLGLVHTRGLSGSEVDIIQAAEAGAASIEHLSGLALAYQRAGGNPMASAVDGEILDRLVERLVATGVTVVPTVAAVLQFSHHCELGMDGLPGADILAPGFEGYWNMLEQALEGVRERPQAELRLLQAALPRLAAAGVVIGAGSDVPAAPCMPPGPALHQELEALVTTGLSPVQALQAATINAAGILGRDELGHLEPGAVADLVVVDGDPSLDIRDSRRVRAVWQAGREVDRHAALAALEDALRAAAEDQDQNEADGD